MTMQKELAGSELLNGVLAQWLWQSVQAAPEQEMMMVMVMPFEDTSGFIRAVAAVCQV